MSQPGKAAQKYIARHWGSGRCWSSPWSLPCWSNQSFTPNWLDKSTNLTMPACQIVIFAEYRDGGVCQRAMSLANHWWLWRCFLHGTHRWTQKPLTCSKFYLCCVRRVLHEHWTTMFILYTHVIQSYDYKTYFWLAAFFKVVVSSTCWVVPTMLQLVTRGDWWEASSGWKRGGCSAFQNPKISNPGPHCWEVSLLHGESASPPLTAHLLTSGARRYNAYETGKSDL